MQKNVVFVVQKLADGGAERIVSILCNALASKGIKVSLCVYFPTQNEYCLRKDVKKVYLSESEVEYRKLGFVEKLIKIREILKKIDADFIVPFLYFVGIHVQLACLGCRYKIIQTVRNDPSSIPKGKVKRIVRNLTLRVAWCVFVQNKRQLEYFSETVRKKTVILPNPVSDVFFEIQRPNRKIYTIVAAGRLHEQKNYPMLIKAAAILKKRKYEFVIKIYGEGPERSTLDSLVKKYDVDSCCILCGRSNDMKTVYQDADIFVMTSNYEGMPNALMEAMASGLPCVSTDCPSGPSELITDEVTGFLVRINDHNQLADKIARLLNNSELSKCIGDKARNEIKSKYTEDIISERFIMDVLNHFDVDQ